MTVFSYDTYKTHVRKDNPGYNKTFSSLRKSGLRSLMLKHNNEDFSALPVSERKKITTALGKINKKYANVRTYVNQCLAPPLPPRPSRGPRITSAQLQAAIGSRHHVTDSPMDKVLSGPKTHAPLVSLDLHKMTGPVQVIFSKCPFWERVGAFGQLWTSEGGCPPAKANSTSAVANSCNRDLVRRGRNPKVNLTGFLLECQSILRMIESSHARLLDGVRLLQKGNPNLSTTNNSVLKSCKRFWGILGTNDATRKHWNSVLTNYAEMRSSLVASRSSGNHELLRVVESSESPCGVGNYAFTYPSVRRPPFIWLGNAVFEDVTGGLPAHPGISTSYIRYDNTAMTLLHELSHAVVGTNDVAPYRKHSSYRAPDNTRLRDLSANADYPGANGSAQTISLGTRLVTGVPQMYFTTRDIEDLATHRPKWTAVNAHSYACFGAHCDKKAPANYWR